MLIIGFHNTVGWVTMAAKKVAVTTIQVTTGTRDRMYRLKFRRTYDEFLQELCDLYEKTRPE